MISLKEFQSDRQGSKFSDVINDKRIDFCIVIDFFNNLEIIRRMEESELHHERTPFAGVVKTFEKMPMVDEFLKGYDAHTTQRFRQATGVLIRMHMESRGWRTTGKKGSLGTRAKVKPGTKTPGSHYNVSGLSRWFTKAERYKKDSLK